MCAPTAAVVVDPSDAAGVEAKSALATTAAAIGTPELAVAAGAIGAAFPPAAAASDLL